MTDYVKIYSGTSILVNRLAYLLDKRNIASFVKDNKESGRLAGFGTLGMSVNLFVHKEDFDSVSETLENFQKEIS